MWEEQIFEKGQVKVNTVLKEMNTATGRLGKAAPVEAETPIYFLSWSVERL